MKAGRRSLGCQPLNAHYSMVKMVTSVLRPIWKRDVVFMIDLKDANFQIPISRGLESLWLHT